MMLRRDFLKAMSLATAIAPSVSVGQVFAHEVAVPSVLWLRRGGDEARVDYATEQGYRYVTYLLRDVQARFVGTPDPRLLQLLAWQQAWLAAYGYVMPFKVHSGCRTNSTNSREGGVQNSQHLPDEAGVFRAVDFSTKEVSAEYMGRLAYLAQQGGVGFYNADGFVHNDVGRVRTWRGRAGNRR